MDFKLLLNELLDAGLTQSEIARHIGLKPQSIPDILKDRQRSVKWPVGNAILQLHQICIKSKIIITQVS
jgi:DNA-binding XRE family transcriptional regulator